MKLEVRFGKLEAEFEVVFCILCACTSREGSEGWERLTQVNFPVDYIKPYVEHVCAMRQAFCLYLAP